MGKPHYLPGTQIFAGVGCEDYREHYYESSQWFKGWCFYEETM